jgi:hypothetical protein
MTPAARLGVALVCLVSCLGLPVRLDAMTAEAGGDDIRLELSPRICTLGSRDRQCDTRVQASWHASREQSLCLVIVDRPEVKKCWERYSEGTYTIELEFSTDLTFQLKDFELQQVLASEAIRVIKEAIQYRHKRRQPWNVFD